jgi:MFS transporter, SHS family, lactate transporter
VRATASGFCYHQGAIWAGFTGPVLTYFAANQPLGFTVPMLIATSGAAVVFVVTLLFSPETRGKELVPQLTLVAESSAA